VTLTLGFASDYHAQSPKFSTGVDVVRVDVLVLERGRLVTGLRAEDFAVWDNGVRQQVELVSVEELPLTLMLALDGSGSVAGDRVRDLRRAATSLFGALAPADKVGLLTFSADVVVHAAPTRDAPGVLAALERAFVGGDTSLVDACYSAVALAESGGGRPVAIVFSDGVDTSSFLRPEDVLAAARRSDTVVYAVTVGTHESAPFLTSLSEDTGGRTLRLASSQELQKTLLDLLSEVRQRYVVSFSPRGISGRGWHRLEVRIPSRRATVKARRGYMG
jgi:VWFA-related protein